MEDFLQVQTDKCHMNKMQIKANFLSAYSLQCNGLVCNISITGLSQELRSPSVKNWLRFYFLGYFVKKICLMTF